MNKLLSIALSVILCACSSTGRKPAFIAKPTIPNSDIVAPDEIDNSNITAPDTAATEDIERGPLSRFADTVAPDTVAVSDLVVNAINTPDLEPAEFVSVVYTWRMLNDTFLKPKSWAELLLEARNAEQYCYEAYKAWIDAYGYINHEAEQRWFKSIRDWNNLNNPRDRVQLEQFSGGFPRHDNTGGFHWWISGRFVEDKGRNAPANRYVYP